MNAFLILFMFHFILYYGTNKNILFKTNRIINIIYIFRFSFKSSLTRYILIFKTLDHIYECPQNGQF